ncbi:pseudouridine-5'-phosphate glycosidase [Brevibacillus laterosporus]|uniref:pseudouridine-5'-phosphate glycosidase n=1 Tax=Brevibacillus laterosporus TaxID=1465 RepID=UPI00037B4100|nr:pseudouridine-5'-phosphate glycosidase [Brevibacillus laterosporus]ATO48791.1 pseudouridine-5-phosphate glycosidase [Brevibacillus laterosporus DSM 25]MBG9786667.1 pseudouridine-5'-phosphate glycosidase [Brevibacillus laterosporus]MBG9797658.1 pseudouridine-5'-phosphate glycosidase [Brevibacillus laterosporus]MBG9800653.1 pseudouridine-5'-phosphate glycosidase [Brevibacillus laterosporus]MCG7319885.1 pseudouridine-5'-phosphate glycosidase [Brevibacillus laterosporus]
MKNYLTFTEEVAHALENKLPIVALETTIISHGMPYPQNIEMAKKVEQIIRDNGAVPATIGIMDGKIKIGLTDQELQEFATNKSVEKVSRRDFPYILATGKIGATTVAGTMIAAELAGIEMFATGGIGGVHREGEVTWDVSADLTELANTSVAVVCAGCKSILDIGRTLEYLETQGVPVVGYKTDEFPSFYSRKSGYGVDFKLDTPDSVASVMDTKWKLGMQGGMVISNPVPEESALPYDQIEAAIQQALAEAKENNIAGKKVTPFLLSKVKELTAGKSLETNIALVYHNAEVAAKIAVEYKKKQHQ